jgi:phosphoglucosamine mutase
MGKYFGTDGIRGVANKNLDAMLAFKVGRAAATAAWEKGKKPIVIIGKDTRISSDMLEAALSAGICSAGGDVVTVGVIPTPAVAYLTMEMGADMGIVISASHNSFEHNGIKIFSEEGFKLPDETEERIEELIDNEYMNKCMTFADIGTVEEKEAEGREKYVDFIVGCAKDGIENLRVLIDCANGASFKTAEKIFGSFPIDVDIINARPTGININDNCGSTHMDQLADGVVAGGYDVGIAFDGDADRFLAVDEKGGLLDGDKIIAICSGFMKQENRLRGNIVVSTVMSNLGFHDYMGRREIELYCTDVGDRNVLEKMLEIGGSIGGEQSGHIIFLDELMTGDGQLSAVKFLEILSRSGKKASELAADIPEYPQVLLNVPLEGNARKDEIMRDTSLKEAIKKEEEALGSRGRILVRPSGTEELIRVMVEAETEETAVDTAQRLSDLIKMLQNNT